MCRSIQQTGESAQLVEMQRMPELTTHSAVAQVENVFRDTMESVQQFSTWLWLEVWLQSEKPDSSSQMVKNLVTCILYIQNPLCLSAEGQWKNPN